MKSYKLLGLCSLLSGFVAAACVGYTPLDPGECWILTDKGFERRNPCPTTKPCPATDACPVGYTKLYTEGCKYECFPVNTPPPPTPEPTSPPTTPPSTPPSPPPTPVPPPSPPPNPCPPADPGCFTEVETCVADPDWDEGTFDQCNKNHCSTPAQRLDYELRHEGLHYDSRGVLFNYAGGNPNAKECFDKELWRIDCNTLQRYGRLQHFQPICQHKITRVPCPPVPCVPPPTAGGCGLPPATGDCRTNAGGPDLFKVEVAAAIEQVKREHRDYFNPSDVGPGGGWRVLNGDAYHRAVAAALNTMGLCAIYDNGEEIAVKRTNDVSEQWDIYIGAGYIGLHRAFVCKPANKDIVAIVTQPPPPSGLASCPPLACFGAAVHNIVGKDGRPRDVAEVGGKVIMDSTPYFERCGPRYRCNGEIHNICTPEWENHVHNADPCTSYRACEDPRGPQWVQVVQVGDPVVDMCPRGYLCHITIPASGHYVFNVCKGDDWKDGEGKQVPGSGCARELVSFDVP